MKRYIVMILVLMLMLSMAACGNNGGTDAQLEITRATEETPVQAEPDDSASEVEENADADFGPFAFVDGEVTMVPGTAFDAAQMPEAISVYEVPSCAIEGTDNVYNYGTYEVTAFKDTTGEVIYSIYILDANITTPEGLALGDSLDKLIELYGDGYEVNGKEYFYTSEETILSVLVQNDVIISIEYRWDV